MTKANASPVRADLRSACSRLVSLALLALTTCTAATEPEASVAATQQAAAVNNKKREIMFVIDGSASIGGRCSRWCTEDGSSSFIPAGVKYPAGPNYTACPVECDPKDLWEKQRQGLIAAIRSLPTGGSYAV